jgi:hypothetical protein
MPARGRKSAALWAALAACAALGASALVAFCPPPSTFARLCPPQGANVRAGRFAGPACNGVQCTLCPYECFLPEGARGRCKVRAVYGGKIKTLIYSQARP